MIKFSHKPDTKSFIQPKIKWNSSSSSGFKPSQALDKKGWSTGLRVVEWEGESEWFEASDKAG